MIVRDRPNALHLLFALRGSIVPEIAPHILCAGLFAGALVLVNRFHVLDISHYSVAPVALLGIVLSILLSFRNNASYERWWEARKQWGQMVYEIRSLGRVSASFLGNERSERRQLLMLALGFAHALRGQLRQENVSPDLERLLGPELAGMAQSQPNPADHFLLQIGGLLGRLKRDDVIDSIGLQTLDARVTALAGIQAACERIASTPLPFAYTLLVHRTSYLYCYVLPFVLAGSLGWATPFFVMAVAYTFFGIDCLARHLETPFGRKPNDLPLDALCRVHEISVAQALGDTPPKPLAVVNHELQ